AGLRALRRVERGRSPRGARRAQLHARAVGAGSPALRRVGPARPAHERRGAGVVREPVSTAWPPASTDLRRPGPTYNLRAPGQGSLVDQRAVELGAGARLEPGLGSCYFF